MSTIERLPLTRERVALAALRVGDDGSIEAITMRNVAASLGVEAMSLYNHVDSKDDLLDAIGDALFAEVLDAHRAEPDDTWQDEARAVVRAYRQVALRHPNLAPIMLERPLFGGAKIAVLQRCHQVFVRAGFSIDRAALVFNTVASWLSGSVRSELGLMRALEEMGPISHDDVPSEFHDAVDFMQSCVAHTADERFDAGFELLLAGIETQLAD